MSTCTAIRCSLTYEYVSSSVRALSAVHSCTMLFNATSIHSRETFVSRSVHLYCELLRVDMTDRQLIRAQLLSNPHSYHAVLFTSHQSSNHACPEKKTLPSLTFTTHPSRFTAPSNLSSRLLLTADHASRPHLLPKKHDQYAATTTANSVYSLMSQVGCAVEVSPILLRTSSSARQLSAN